MADSIEAQVAWLKATVEAHGRDLDRLGPVAGEQIRTTADVAVMEKELEDFKRWVAEVEARLSVELKAQETRQEERTARVERACSAWADKLDKALPRLTVVESKQGRGEEDESQRRNLLYGIAGAFAATAFGVIAKLLGLL